MLAYRDMTEGDFEDVGVMLLEMHNESPFFSQFEPDGEYFVSMMDYVKDHFAKVAVYDGIIIGLMLGHTTTVAFTTAKMAQEILVYVSPEYRGGRAGISLIHSFEQYAIDHDADVISVGVSAAIDADMVCSLYERLGYASKSFNYMKRIT